MAKFGRMTPRTKKTQKSKFLLTKSTLRLMGLKYVCIQVDKNAVGRILKNIASSSRKWDFSIFSLCDSRKTTKSADFGLFFDFACFQASFDVFYMRWDVRNITLEVQTMGSEGLQACKHSKFHLSRPFWRQKSLLHCLHWDFTIFDFRRGLMEGSVFCKTVRD